MGTCGKSRRLTFLLDSIPSQVGTGSGKRGVQRFVAWKSEGAKPTFDLVLAGADSVPRDVRPRIPALL